jgi:hypothetical protein
MGTILGAVFRFLQLKKIIDYVTATATWQLVRAWVYAQPESTRTMLAIVVGLILLAVLFV